MQEKKEKTLELAIVCVNYNSYTQLSAYLKSISVAAEKASEKVNVSVFIADNSAEHQKIIIDQYQSLHIKVFALDNLGYFGAASYVIKQIPDKSKYDYIIISNVDLTIAPDFFKVMEGLNVADNVGMIAPTIFTQAENRDKNPKIIHRPSKKKMRLLQLMYRFPVLHKLYEGTLYKRKKIRPNYDRMEIYAGHGAFIVLTRRFFSEIKEIEYPVFLFGEEQYLAEEMRKHNLTALYEPSLKVYDEEHVSTGAMRRKSYYKYNLQAQTYILNNYYE